MKVHPRIPIFSYSTFASTLLMDSKSLEIKFRKKYLNLETLFELESVLAWCATHSEVQSIIFTTFDSEFLVGFDPEEFKTLNHEKIKKLANKLSTIAQSLYCLPQTTIMNLKNGTSGIGLEFALSADIRIANEDAKYSFNHLEKGLTPFCGLFSYLKNTLNQNVLRSLILSGIEFDNTTINQLGGFVITNLSEKEILQKVFMQAPVARTQAKKGLFGIHQKNDDDEVIIEKQILNSVLITDDYKMTSQFKSHSEYKELIKDL